MRLVRPIFMFVLLMSFCVSLVGSTSYKTNKNKQIEFKKLTQADNNEYFDGKNYVSDMLNIHIRSLEIIPSYMNENTSLLVIKFKFINHSIEKLNQNISWLECFEVEQAGRTLEIVNVSNRYQSLSKRSFKIDTFDRSKGIIAYKLKNTKKDVMLKAYKIDTSKIIGIKKIKIAK